jgi:hypothetical protein
MIISESMVGLGQESTSGCRIFRKKPVEGHLDRDGSMRNIVPFQFKVKPPPQKEVGQARSMAGSTIVQICQAADRKWTRNVT